MVNVSMKVFKIQFLLFAFLITFIKFDTIRGYSKDKRKSSCDFMVPKENHIIFNV